MSAKQKDVGSSPAHDQFFFVQVFSASVRLFSQFFLMSPKGPPFVFFPILQKNGYSKIPKGTLFTFFGKYSRPKIFENKLSKKFGFFNFFLTRVLS